MNTTTLLEKLVEIERALQCTDYGAAHALVLEAEDCVLQLEREMIRTQAKKLLRVA